MKRVNSTNLDWDTFLAHKSEFPEAWTLDHSHWQALSASQCSEPVWSAVQFHKLQNTERQTTFTQTQGADPGFLERGFVCIKVWGIHFADFISFVLNIP